MTPKTHAMLDLETLGVGPSPVIMAVGLVFFRQKADYSLYEVERHSYNVSIQSCLDVGLQTDGSTHGFWLWKASPEARLAMETDQRGLEAAVGMCNSIISLHNCGTLWSRGQDWGWWAAACRALRVRSPDYWRVRDVRTLLPDKPLHTAHIAVDDALAQVAALSAFCQQRQWGIR